MPLVSIITIVYNGIRQVEQTIASVLGQTYENIEYIVIDGGSTDGTVEIIKRYQDRIAYWVSEPDNGISDAFNKGINAATGEFVGLLNADDRMSADQVALGVQALLNSSADYIFGDLLFHDETGCILYRINGDPDYQRIIDSKMPELCHPTVLARKALYDRIGLFDTRYRYAMDYDWLLRLHRNGGRGLYVKRGGGTYGDRRRFRYLLQGGAQRSTADRDPSRPVAKYSVPAVLRQDHQSLHATISRNVLPRRRCIT